MLFFTAALFAVSLSAQNQGNIWLKGALSLKINEKLSTEFEYKYRSQNNLNGNNPLEKPLLESYKVWFKYKQDSIISYGFAPFAYLRNRSDINEPADLLKPIKLEYRTSAYVYFTFKLSDKWTLGARELIDFRHYPEAGNSTARFREKISFKYSFNKKLSLSLFDEIFLNFYGQPKGYLYNQNRLGLTVEIKPIQGITISPGYIFLNYLPSNSSSSLNKNVFMLNLKYKI